MADKQVGRSAIPSVLIGMAVLLGGCGDSNPRSSEVLAPDACETLAEQVSTLMVDLAEHAAKSGGLPANLLQVQHPDEVDAWEVATALADGSPDLRARVAAASNGVRNANCRPGWAYPQVERRAAIRVAEGKTRLASQFDREEYATLNVVAIVAATWAPPPDAHPVPDGFPPEFPVHPDAEVVANARQDDGSVTATWTVKRGSVEEVADYYESTLREVRFGGWAVNSSSGAGSNDGDVSDTSFDVAGYGFAGRLDVGASDESTGAIVVATLQRSAG